MRRSLITPSCAPGPGVRAVDEADKVPAPRELEVWAVMGEEAAEEGGLGCCPRLCSEGFAVGV